jgi:hypothetical protein
MAMLLLVSCQAAPAEPAPVAKTTPDQPPAATLSTSDNSVQTSSPITPEPTAIPLDYNPLTGLQVADPSRLDRLPVLIKVSNYPRTGRPHAGLSSADIVFDYYIGEMFNRFVAIFYGNDAPQVGPLRSGRLEDSQLTQMFRGILVYGNADERVDSILTKDLGARAIPYKFAPCPPVCGDDTHSVTGVFADSAGVTEFARQSGVVQERPGLQFATFSTDPPAGGESAMQLLVQYADISR